MAIRPRKTKDSDEKVKAVVKDKKAPVVALTLKPRLSEKAFATSDQVNTYIFDVPAGANKHTIAAAVASQFEVSVTGVRLASVPGKSVRSYRNRGRKSIYAKRSNLKKAYVSLGQGDKLPIFAAVEEPKAPEEKK